MEDVKIYGLCLERLKYQVGLAYEKKQHNDATAQNRYLLESYHSADIDDIIDILELYDLDERTSSHLREKLDELAYTVSLLISETMTFDLTDEGHLGLYLVVTDEAILEPEHVAAAEVEI